MPKNNSKNRTFFCPNSTKNLITLKIILTQLRLIENIIVVMFSAASQGKKVRLESKLGHKANLPRIRRDKKLTTTSGHPKNEVMKIDGH